MAPIAHSRTSRRVQPQQGCLLCRGQVSDSDAGVSALLATTFGYQGVSSVSCVPTWLCQVKQAAGILRHGL